ncbi:MAG TPA: prolipoprotein diacylglyceryl transferase [Tepidisphaeraceae bacterium]|nr:prolipoprotein diacylglyceryl transferase [Tepidisphaeraceae bacterium]
MLQELFRIPILNLPIYSYGLMMVIGFLCAIQLAQFLAKRSGLNPELFVNAGLIALITGIAGARISHVIENISQYTTVTPTRSVWDNFFDAINIRSGGLTYYGGFLLAFPSLVFYAIKKKIPIRLGMDIVAPCIVLGLGFGRIGCFLNGCCYGDQCDLPWAVQFPYHSLAYEEEVAEGKIAVPSELLIDSPDGKRLLTKEELANKTLSQKGSLGLPIPIDPQAPAMAASQKSLWLHPAQLYSAFTAFLIAAISLTYFTLPHATGRAFALMLLLEGSTRFILELLRVEPPVIGNFSLSMIIGLGVASLGVLLWIIFGQIYRQATENQIPHSAVAKA